MRRAWNKLELEVDIKRLHQALPEVESITGRQKYRYSHQY